MKNIEDLLEYQRKKLLDTSRRTPLLNYRLTSKAIEIESEWPQDIFHHLVNRQKSLVFLAKIEDEEEHLDKLQLYVEDSSDEDDLDSDFSELDDELQLNGFRVDTPLPELVTGEVEHEEEASRYTALKNTLQDIYRRLISRGKLPTTHDIDDLKKRIISIYRDIKRFNRELGVNPYYLTIGMLEWSDPERSQNLNQAPLLLIPVEITQKNRFADYEVHYAEGEVEFNNTLYEKLQEGFDIKLPSETNIEIFNIQDYFSQIENNVQNLGWKIDRRKITLTLFASKKFLMHKDLKFDSWPSESSPEKNPTIYRLLRGGFQRSRQSSFRHTHFIDSIISPFENFQIDDADSSQLMAIYHVKSGHDLIIQGPPGTGKSQTITNIIAQAVGDDKTVLFVAQKETALNVVKDKLNKANLGQLCLELHGPKTKRGEFLRDVQQTLDSSKDTVAQRLSGDLQGLIAIRDQLNNYCQAVNTPFDKEIMTPFQCFEELLRLRDVFQKINPPRWPDKDVFNRARPLQYHEWLPKIENLQKLLAEIGMPKDNAFRFCRYSEDTFIAPEQIRQFIRQSQTALDGLEKAAIELATHLRIPSPTTKRQAQLLIYLSEHILQVPPLDGVDIRSNKWQRNAGQITNTINAIRQSNELQRKYNSILLPGAWTKDITTLREQVEINSNVFQRFFPFPAKIPDGFAEICLTEPPRSIKEQLSILEAISSFQSYQKTIEDQEALFKKLLGEKTWKETRSDSRYLSNLTNWLKKLHQTIHAMNLSSSIIDYLEERLQPDTLKNLRDSLENNLKKHEITVSLLTEQLQLDEEGQFGKGHTISTQTFKYQNELLTTWFTCVNQLKDIIDYNRLKNDLVSDGFVSIVEIAEAWPEANNYLADLMKYTWYLHLINQNSKHQPELVSFNRVAHEAKIQKFCELDTALFDENRSYIASKHNEALLGLDRVEDPDIQRQLELIRRQCRNAGTKLSIRKIMDDAGAVIQTLKPVFMMSPASVAEFLPPAKVKFDLIIFDEASQIKPEDATGAILRGNQTVVVGDRFQLPPTDFFKTSTGSNNLEDVIDAESILDFFYIGGAPETTLLWHYRSQHHSLITPSNHEFYNDELIAFPSPRARNEKLGVSFFHVPDSVYDRGGSRTNLVEARNVAQAVIHHAENDAGSSLGVVALNKEQAGAIEHEITLLRDQNPGFEDFFQDEERFFVTYLENVQGDEKEVIFISIGYGFSIDGKLTLNFGPISQQGGERRLNVLTTRARKQCIVFSSIRARDITERNPSSRGAKFLAEYLAYAQEESVRSYEEIQRTLHKNEDYKKKRDRLQRLMEMFNKKFNMEELRIFCFHLHDFDFENIPGDTKVRKATELALHFHRRENIKQLIQVGKQQRPDINWSELDLEEIDESLDEKYTPQDGDLIGFASTIKDSFYDKDKSSTPGSQLEDEVAEALQALGYHIERQVGPPNAAIPIAVIDEEEQTALLGIEFDGPDYYQARSARDRDRLRRQELEKLEWKIHRIWIIDWYYNKERELNRLIQAINEAQQQRKNTGGF